MFVTHAKVRIVGLGGRSKRRRPSRRRLAIREVLKMPCLLPTAVTVFLGLLAVVGGAGMSVFGYIPSAQVNSTYVPFGASLDGHGVYTDANGNASAFLSDALHVPTRESTQIEGARFYLMKICAYTGPIIMAVGMFAMIVACVFYCEILDKYAILVPDKRAAVYEREELYEKIVGEMKKSYAQSLITAYSKAAERSLLTHDNRCGSEGYLPDFPLKQEPLTMEQQIDIECEGYTPSPPLQNKRYSVIQARIQRLRSEDQWLKTSSLPNIRRSDRPSIRRAGRVGIRHKVNSLSCDYTMDEARLRRKSMMLRSIINWNSGSSGELQGHGRQRRFSSVKALPSHHHDSWDAVSHAGFAGSYPMTRLIQRRGTFACGDMRTRRMKFLLLLQASESKDLFSDVSVERARPRSAIRRNSFIPYTTCDKFISGEEKKTMRDRRRSSVNPFTFGNRFGNTVPKPGTRRHSFFPIRRDDKIYVSDPYEQRRHSFNPACVKPDFGQPTDGRRGSYNPDSRRGSYNPDSRRSSYYPDSRRGSFNPDSLPDRANESRRPSYVQQKPSMFLTVPGFESEFQMERRPSTDSSDSNFTPKPGHTASDSSFTQVSVASGQNTLGLPEETRPERRYSYNPGDKPEKVSSISTNKAESDGEKPPNFVVPKITISAVTAGRSLNVPQEHGREERRHSFNCMPTTKHTPFNSTAASSQPIEKPSPQRITFRLGPSDPSSPPHASSVSPRKSKSSTSTSGSKMGSEPVRPSSFKQEMVVFKPLPSGKLRSVSPSSNMSCYGSEKVGSELTVRTSSPTNVSVASEQSVKTTRAASPASAGFASDRLQSYGTFGVTSPGREEMVRSKSPQPFYGTRHTLQVTTSPLSCAIQLNAPPGSTGARRPSSLVRKASSFKEPRELDSAQQRLRGHRHRSSQGSSRRYQPRVQKEDGHKDSPSSCASGPAMLSPSFISDANAAISKSRSATALSREADVVSSKVRPEGRHGSSGSQLSPSYAKVRLSPQPPTSLQLPLLTSSSSPQLDRRSKTPTEHASS